MKPKVALYVIRGNQGLVKIGISKYPGDRLRTLRAETKQDLDFILCCEVDDAESHEKNLHLEFAQQREHGEWFRLTHEQIQCIADRYPHNASKSFDYNSITPVRIPLETLNIAKSMAKHEGRSLSNWIVRLIESALEQDKRR